ncbi:uncharacterized protein LOC111347923 [Spodoptera litura]|uniref:Uncharacterized protein LOC111347923 n=1 Tax=Spodoptera litura TaxID=69820 RepID=A0A9J7DL03_SPOLT|nr:uncharacterized protein LOC111347923 [Spodoptera litura]
MGVAISCMSNIMYLSEKIILYSTCVGLVTSVVLMFVVTLGMGIGLGYNYCFVDMKTKYKYVPGHYVYPHNLRYPYYRRAGDQGQQNQGDQNQALQEDATLDRAAEEQKEIDELRNGPVTPPFYTPVDRRAEMMKKLGLISRDYSIFPNSTTEAYDFDNEEDVTNTTVVEVDIGTQSDNITAATEGTETTETITTTETIETDETTETFEATDTTEATDSKTDDMYSVEDPTQEPAFPDEKRRVKKLVIPISGLDLVSLLSKLSAEKNNHSLQIVTT